MGFLRVTNCSNKKVLVNLRNVTKIQSSFNNGTKIFFVGNSNESILSIKESFEEIEPKVQHEDGFIKICCNYREILINLNNVTMIEEVKEDESVEIVFTDDRCDRKIYAPKCLGEIEDLILLKKGKI